MNKTIIKKKLWYCEQDKTVLNIFGYDISFKTKEISIFADVIKKEK